MNPTPWEPLRSRKLGPRGRPKHAPTTHPPAAAPEREPAAAWRPTPAARRLALAVWIERALTEGRLHNYAHAARVLGVSRARVAQIRRLAFAAPEQVEATLGTRTRPS